MPRSRSRRRSARPAKRSGSTSRSRKWHASIKKRWGKGFHDRLERCVRKVKAKGSGAYSPYAVCFASLKGTTKHHRGSPKRSRRRRSRY